MEYQTLTRLDKTEEGLKQKSKKHVELKNKRKHFDSSKLSTESSRESKEKTVYKKQRKSFENDLDNSQNNQVSENNISTSQKRKKVKFEKLIVRNPAAEFIKECKKLYAQLLCCKTLSETERVALVQKTLDFIDQFDITSDEAFFGKARLLSVNRCLQVCYKLGNSAQKKFMLQQLEFYFVKLAYTNTGSFLCIKMLKYSDEPTKIRLCDSLFTDSFSNIVFSRYGSKVLDYALSLPKPFPSEKFLHKLINKLCIPNVIALQVSNHHEKNAYNIYLAVDDRGKKQIKECVDSAITRCIDKELANRVFFHSIFEFASQIYDQEEHVGLCSTLQECFPLLMSSPAGCLTMCRLLDIMTAKQRKKFIQSWKQHLILPLDVCMNSVSYIVLLKLLTTVDDTKLLKEALIDPLLKFKEKATCKTANAFSDIQHISTICSSAIGQKTFLLILSENLNTYMSPKECSILNSEKQISKKDKETRRAELLPSFLQSLQRVFEKIQLVDFLESWMQNKICRNVLTEYMKISKDAHVLHLLEKLLNDSSSVQTIWDHQVAQRTLLSIVRIGSNLSKTPEESIDISQLPRLSNNTFFVVYLWNLINEEHVFNEIVMTRGVFVIVDLLKIIKATSLVSASHVKSFVRMADASLKQHNFNERQGIKLLKKHLLES